MKLFSRLSLYFFCVILMLLSCVSCDGSQAFREDLSVSALSTEILNALPVEDGWNVVSDDYISPSTWGEDYADYLELVSEHRITVSAESDMNVDEIGIFRVKNIKDVNRIKKFVEQYLEANKLRMTPLLESYNQAELPKLDCADVSVCGHYVLYTILDASDTTAAHSAFETALTKSENN